MPTGASVSYTHLHTVLPTDTRLLQIEEGKDYIIPAFFKAKFGTNETLFTLMLNYIALYLISFLRDGPWQDPNSSGFPKIARFGENAQLDKLFGVHVGWLIGLVLVVIVYILSLIHIRFV